MKDDKQKPGSKSYWKKKERKARKVQPRKTTVIIAVINSQGENEEANKEAY